MKWLRQRSASLIQIVLLSAPSIWMLSVIPPLWKDIDAYIQVTQPPGFQTIVQYGPLYSLLARFPLYIGYTIESLRAGEMFPPLTFFLRPTLTDSGVLTLLFSQHAALCCSAFFLISGVSRFPIIRLLLAGLWAANPLFYSLAHCVGSETLSLILVLLLAATGMKIVRRPRRVPKKEWWLFGLLLWLGILTRHLNAILGMVMPLTFLFFGVHKRIISAFDESRWARRSQQLWAKRSLQQALGTIGLGLSCIILANICLRGLCNAAHIPHQLQPGYSFLWRLEFLRKVPPDTANQLLERAANNTSAPDVKALTLQLREAVMETVDWNATAFMREVHVSLFAEDSASREKCVQTLNQTVRAFLWPPSGVFLKAVATDFAKAGTTTIPNIVQSLFVHTIFYYSHPDAMPGYAALATFRDQSPESIMALYKDHPYFYHRTKFSYATVWYVWLALISLLAFVTKKRGGEMAVVYYAAALVVVGLTIMLASCLLGQFQPRYTLPMWELMIISTVIVLGRCLDRALAHWQGVIGPAKAFAMQLKGSQHLH